MCISIYETIILYMIACKIIEAIFVLTFACLPVEILFSLNLIIHLLFVMPHTFVLMDNAITLCFP